MDEYGSISWWGFSPACDLQQEGKDICSCLKNMDLRDSDKDEVNILLVGAGDLRHIQTTICRAYRHSKKKLNFYVVETSLELYARDMLLLTVAMEPQNRMGLQDKTELFLELFGNSLVRKQSMDYVQKMATMFIRMVTDFDYMSSKMPIFDLSNLKFKERDLLEAIFKLWRNPDPSIFDAKKCWDLRLRQYLATRYDAIPNVFDWDFTMKLSERGRAAVIGGRLYAQWREKGVAFEIRDGTYDTSNKTLASGMIFKHEGERHGRRGYWGDMVVSPYIAYGIRSENSNLFKTSNKVFNKNGQDVSEYNVLSLLHELTNREKYTPPECDDQDSPSSSATLTEITEEEEDNEDISQNPQEAEYEPLNVDYARVIFLPISSTSELHKKSKYDKLFNVVYIANSLVHLLNKDLTSTFSDEAAVLLETAKFMVTLSNEQVGMFVDKITGIAQEAGCKAEEAYDAVSDSLARFKFTRPTN